MINTKYEEKKIMTNVIKSCTCDACEKEIITKEVPKGWYEFMASHYEWGNDSVDSIEHYLSCSFECYLQNLKQALEDFKDYPSAKIDDKSITFLNNYFNKI